jgi:hypothetical protein
VSKPVVHSMSTTSGSFAGNYGTGTALTKVRTFVSPWMR